MSGIPCTPSLRDLNLGCDRTLPPCAWSLPLRRGLPACFRSSELLPPGTSSLCCCSSVPPPPGSLPKLPRRNSLSAVHTLCKRLTPHHFLPWKKRSFGRCLPPLFVPVQSGRFWSRDGLLVSGAHEPRVGAFDKESWRRGLHRAPLRAAGQGGLFREGRA